MAAGDTGGLLISAHIGNFEMAGHMLERFNTRVNIIMLDAEHQRIKNYLSAITRKSFHIIPIGEDNAHVYEINKALKTRKFFACMATGLCKAAKPCQLNFWEKDAEFPTGPFYLAMKYGIPVSFVFAMKEEIQALSFLCHTPPVVFTAK